ncbi:MAG: MFS transporter [Anaerolineales bacterium]
MKTIDSIRRLNARLGMSVSWLATGGKWAIEFPKETQRNLKYFFFDGVSASASDSIVTTYITLYLLALGASSASIGLMASLASLSAVFLLIPGAVLVERTGKRKEIVLISSGIIRRFALLLLAFIPLILSGNSAVFAVIALKVVMDGMGNLGIPAWTSMIADIVPLSRRGRFFGNRNMAMGIAAMITTYLVGVLITKIGPPEGYQWALGLSFFFGIISTSFFFRITESNSVDATKSQIAKSSYTLTALISTLKTDQNFMIYCGYAALWTFSINIAAPFFSVYLVQNLNATAAIVGVTALISQMAALPAQKLFGGLADKWGPRKLMMVTGFIIPILPFLWSLTREYWHVYPINAIGGFIWAGYGIGSFNFLLSISPSEQRARYTALYQIAVAGSAAIGAALGGVVSNFTSLMTVFILSGIGRIIAAAIFFKFVHPSSEEQSFFRYAR